VYAAVPVPVPVLVLAGAAALGGTTALVVVICAFARCEVTRWNVRHVFALARGRAFTEPRPTDCGCRRCTRHRRRSTDSAGPDAG
jgi:hypothetical protein